MTVQQQVSKGMALLDAKRPGWRDKIDLDKLSLFSSYNCILGQVFGHMRTGLTALGLRPIEPDLVNSDVPAKDHGFTCGGWLTDCTCKALEDEWRARLARVPA